MLLMALEKFKASLQQALQLGIVSRRDQKSFERAIHLLMEGNFVGEIGFVVGGPVELRQFGLLVGGFLGQVTAGVVVLGRDVELFYEIQRLLVHGFMVAL